MGKELLRRYSSVAPSTCSQQLLMAQRQCHIALLFLYTFTVQIYKIGVTVCNLKIGNSFLELRGQMA